jgi:hypothetical protein
MALFWGIRSRTWYSLILALGIFLATLSWQYMLSFAVDIHASLDAGYYHTIAMRVAQGKGFTEPFIWHFLRDYTVIERPIDYWQPLGILIYALPHLMGFPSGERALNHLLWALLTVLVFHETLTQTKRPLFAGFSAALFGLGGKYAFYVSTTDNVAFYALFGFLFFRTLFRAETLTDGGATGFFAGLLTLTRIEGPIFAVLAGFVLLTRRRYRALGALTLVFFLTISPWMVRNYQEFGTPWTSNLKAIFLRSYDDMFEPGLPLSWETMIENGWWPLLQAKGEALRRNLMEFFLIPFFLVLLPIWVLGITVGRRAGGWWLGFGTIGFYLLNGLLFSTQSVRGTALHTLAAFFPHFMIFVGTGFQTLLSRNRNAIPGFFPPSGDESRGMVRPRARAFEMLCLGAVLVWAGVFTISGIHFSREAFRAENQPYQQLFHRHPLPPGSLVTSGFPAHVTLYTGCGGVILPPSRVLTADQWANSFGCEYILFDERCQNTSLNGIAFEGWTLIASQSPLILLKAEKP